MLQGWVTLSARRALSISVRRKPRHSSKARKALPRISAARPTFRRQPTAASWTPEAAKTYLASQSLPIVVKADGLAAGKGVIIATTREEADAAVDACLSGAFGAAGNEIVIEEFLEGEEASFFALCDGVNALALASAQDHKRVGDGDTGPNTGGMGAYSPAPIITPEMSDRVMREIIMPTVKAMAERGVPFKGVLFAGLMITGLWAEAHRIQCPLRRSRNASLDDAPQIRSSCRLLGDR